MITPADKSLQSVTHTVRQPGAVAVLSPAGYTFEAAGEAADLTIAVPGAIEWSIDESLDWLSVQGSLSRVGSGTVTLRVSPNNTVFARNGTIRIAERDITVTQKGREFEIDYEDMVFGTDGDLASFSVYPDGDMSWKAIASDSWLKFMYGSDEGEGPGEVIFTVGPYVGDGTIRTGDIQIGEQKVLITQRAYDLNISPTAKTVSGNAGAGEIAVSAGIGDIWHAIRTEPWIIIEEGTETGTGSGKVRFTFTDNDTGKTRSGKIIIDGEAYTLTEDGTCTWQDTTGELEKDFWYWVVAVGAADPVITPADGASFVGDSQIVTIDCATPGATIDHRQGRCQQLLLNRSDEVK